MHRSVALAVPLLLVAAVVPAAAAPASASRVAAVRFALPTAAGDRLELELRATAHGSSDAISVSVTRCAVTCAQPRVFAGALPVGALVIDGQVGVVVEQDGLAELGRQSVEVLGVEPGEVRLGLGQRRCGRRGGAVVRRRLHERRHHPSSPCS